ncbi:MAG: hypothetical protein ACYTFQ_00235 [Planctomycetota bacterium]|jgi:hypothetical protein
MKLSDKSRNRLIGALVAAGLAFLAALGISVEFNPTEANSSSETEVSQGAAADLRD